MKGFGSRIQRGAQQAEGGRGSERASEMDEASRQMGANAQESDGLLGTMEGRHEDARVGDERLEERKESQDNDAAAHLGGSQKARDDARAGAGGGGMGGGGSKGKEGEGDQGSAAARASGSTRR